MRNSTTVLRAIDGPSRRKLWQALTRKETRTQLSHEKSADLGAISMQSHTREESHAIFPEIVELTTQLRKADNRIVVFLASHMYIY